MNKTILRLAIPNILSNISVPLLGMVDTAMMGHLDSEHYLGAIALASIIFNFIYWGFGFLRMGTTGITAQAFGQKDSSESMLTLSRAMLVAVIGSILIILTQTGIAYLSFSLIEGEEIIEELGKEYFYIRIYAAPATLGLYVFHGWFLGMQNARYPMWLTIIVNIFNLAFNLLFVFYFDMKSNGVALGTVIAQYLGLLGAIGLFFHSYKDHLAFHSWAKSLGKGKLKHFFSVNTDIFIRTICLVFTFSFFTSKSASIDSMTLAANQILLQYFHLMAYGVDGFAFAAESLVGRFIGEKNAHDLRQSIRLLFTWGVGLGVIFAIVFLLAGEPLLYVFTDQPMVIASAKPYLWWMSVIAVVGAIAFLWDGIYIGATATKAMRNSMLIATVGTFLPVFYVSFEALGNHSLWLAMTLFMVTRGILLGVLAKRAIFAR